MRRGLENVPQKEWSDILPLVEKIEDLTLRPGKRDGKPTDVKFTLTMTKIRDLDAQSSSVGVRMFIALTWHTSFANYRLDETQLWTPKLTFLNDDSLELSSPTPTFYPHTGMVRQVVTVDGLVSQDFDLRVFPWDVNDVSFLIVANLHEKNTVRLFWNDQRDIRQATPKYLNERLTEWNQMEEMNSLQRLPYSEHNQFYGKYNGVQFTMVLGRNIWYYVVKILSIVVMLNIISWGVFTMRTDPEVITEDVVNAALGGGGGKKNNGSSGGGNGGGGNGGGLTAAQLKNLRLVNNGGQSTTQVTYYRDPLLYCDAERYSERLELITGIVLACTTFQFLVGESIPKLGSLTTMDWLLMSSYITLFAMALETIAVHHYSLDGSQFGYTLDQIGGIAVPVLYVGMQSFHILIAAVKRRAQLAKWKDCAGLDPSMLRKNVVSVARMKMKRDPKQSKKGWKSAVRSLKKIEMLLGVREEGFDMARGEGVQISKHRTTSLLPEDEAASKGSEQQKRKSKYAESYAEPIGSSEGD